MDVSIIIPVYNVQEYLRECLDSVIKQTINNKEIIVINDGSTDKCYEILKEYKKKFPEIIIINQENRGISETRNVGLEAAKGEYIAFVDSDDFIKLDMFEKMYKAAIREKSDIVICNYILYKEMPSIQNTDKQNDAKKENGAQGADTQVAEETNKEGYVYKIEALKMFLLNDIKGYLWNKLQKRELFTKNKISFPNFVVCEDTPVSFLLLANSKKIYSMKEPLYYYRQRESSLTTTFSIKAMKDLMSGCYIMRDYIMKDPILTKKLIDYYRVYLIKTLWVIHNKYWIQYFETKDKSKYIDFKKIVDSEINSLKISEIIGNSKLTLKDKVNALFIKTRTYALVFSILYKFRKANPFRSLKPFRKINP
ncbi:glycosyltransferase family 2 protein [Clostridium psychrophilum]|uniref:glycosyltransferase family 2 protein n=1 Tax=Clostridium psychrophilum TaxID=132926 RepID=UPI0028ABF359|nr:glycosyltransferase [Clostridium psychrophilum]